MHSQESSVARLRSVIDEFLKTRLTDKLDKLSDEDPKRSELAAQFEPRTWVADAARRVGQLQAVTHSLKAIHPDARGTSLYATPQSLLKHGLVGSHCLNEELVSDVVGNAAALDVYKFLRLTHDGKTLLQLAQEGDPNLAAALSDDDEQARAWMKAFAGLVEPRGSAASHALAKQIYWLIGDEPADDAQFHLLMPLYASSLAHRVYQTIQDDRFGDAAKAARQARRERQLCDRDDREYRDLAVQKLGGTKPQNISQLNSERGGNNYLLASLPPRWRTNELKPPLMIESVFPRFARRKPVRTLITELRRFLESDPDKTMETRDHRDELVDRIIDELYDFAAEFRALAPAWSGDPRCGLARAETLWLDPDRTLTDADFSDEWHRMEWPAEIRQRFAAWLNKEMGDKLPMGEVEHRHWSDELGHDMRWKAQIDSDWRRLNGRGR
ncbi:MAG: type I-F CRISPR-associated protein Csy1 [Burkholderiaceae bacterium]